jgi:hypothetical protein
MNRKKWARYFWGIEFSEKKDGSSRMLIGGGWHPDNNPRYVGEPSRPILFTSRYLARQWCDTKNDQFSKGVWKDLNWKVRPVRVREVVSIILPSEQTLF